MNTRAKIITIEGNMEIYREQDEITHSHMIIHHLDNVHAIDSLDNSRKHLHPNDPHKFLVSAEDYASSRSEFWARMRIYLGRKFPNTVIKYAITYSGATTSSNVDRVRAR